MTLVLNGTTGVSAVDGSAATPAIQGNDSNTGVFFPAADTVAIATGGTERVRTDSSGNVGIGTSSPGYKLHVNGDLRTQGNFFLANSTGSKIYPYYASATNHNYIGAESDGSLSFGTGTSSPTERARITSSGNLLVPGIYNLTTSAGANVHVASDGTLYRSTSSLKYKKNVQDAVHGLAEVMSLRSVTYKGKSEADGDTVFGGLIAEEVHAAGLTEFVQYAEDGTPDALAYGNMVALAFKAIQEQQALIESLTARIAALEGAKA